MNNMYMQHDPKLCSISMIEDDLTAKITAIGYRDDINSISDKLSELDDSVNCRFNEMTIRMEDIDAIKNEVNAISDQLYDINDRIMIDMCLHVPDYINHVPTRLHKTIISIAPALIQKLKIQSEELCDMIVAQDPSNMKYILYGSDEFFLKHVRQSPEIIQYIQFPSHEVSYAAIDADPMLIKYLYVLDERLWSHAIKLNPYCVNFIKSPTYEMYHKALSLNIKVLNGENVPKNYIGPSNDMLLSLIDDFPTLVLHLPKNILNDLLIIKSIIVLPWIVDSIYYETGYFLSYENYLMAYDLEPGLYDTLPKWVKNTFHIQLTRFKHFLKNTFQNKENI